MGYSIAQGCRNRKKKDRLFNNYTKFSKHVLSFVAGLKTKLI